MQRNQLSDSEMLLLSTLALEEALENSDWTEWEALIQKRAGLIKRLHQDGVDSETLEQVREADDHLAEMLRAKREALVQEIQQTLSGAKNVRSFRGQVPGQDVGRF